MKKRICSAWLALCLTLGLLPLSALAAEESYGPDEEGYGYTISETSFDLGLIEYDGDELTRENAFSVTVTNTGERPIVICKTRFTSEDNKVVFYAEDGTVEPGKSLTLHYTVEIAPGTHIPNGGVAKGPLGMERDYTTAFMATLEVAYIVLNTALTKPEPAPAPTPTQPSGNLGGNTFVPVPSGSSGGQSTPVDISVSKAESQLKLDFGSRNIDLGTIYATPDKSDRTVTITNNSSVEVAVGFAGGTGVLSSNKSKSVYLIEPGESRDYAFDINISTKKKGSDTLDLLVIVEPKTVSQWETSFYQSSYTAGDRYTIEGVYTVSYDIRDVSDAGYDYKLSEERVDFGVVYADEDQSSKTVTLTNTSGYSYYVRIGAPDVLKCDTSLSYLKPGESTVITITPKLSPSKDYIGQSLTREIGIDLTHSAYPTKDSAHVSLEVTIEPEKAAYTISCDNPDNSRGYLATEDGQVIGYVKVPNGEDFTVVMYAPYGVACALVDITDDENPVILTTGEKYTFQNVKRDYELVSYFYHTSNVPADWAKEATAWMQHKGFVYTGTADGFSAPITRERFCELAYNIYKAAGNESIPSGQYETVTFTDTTNSSARALAYLGVINGVGDGAFNPKGQLTRQEAATILSRLAKVLKVELPSTQPTFADKDAVASWAADAVGEMQASGIMGGVGDNQFAPTMTYSMEQSIVTLKRLFDMVK